MNRIASLVVFLSAAAWAQTLDEKVREAVNGFAGTVSLYAKNLDTGVTYGLRENEPVRTASTIKLPIMAAVAAAVENGRARWTDTLLLRDEDKVSGSGVLKEFSGGLQFPLRDLARLMIVVSDNTATNLILDRFTGDYVNEFVEKQLGLAQTRSMRKILGDGKNLKTVPSGLSKEGQKEENKKWGIGRSTPREMVTLLEKLERGDVVNKAVSAEILAIMKRQQYKDGIGRFYEDKLVVASKSGALDTLRSDVGIVYSPGGRIAIAATVEGMREVDYSAENAGNKLIGRLAVLLVDGLQRR
ncbi:MAG: serine hydrolase [Bryobacterales bacterium]|nr:serine hydrolase [Bryobacterales bacterium]